MIKGWVSPLRAGLLGTVLLLAMIGGVQAGDKAANAEAADYRRASAEGATVGFANLADGDVVPPTFTVRFAISGMEVAPAGTDTAGTGHHHLLIDVDELPDLNLPLPANEQFIHFGGGQTETTLTLPEGEHSLKLVLGDHAHIPHNPVVASETIHITVSADAAPQAEN